MKDPKALFPFLFAASWAGNFFLTVLAFYLAFSHHGPLTPMVFMATAVCILSGNLLPIAVYALLIQWQSALLRAESAEVAVHVREALRRSEDVMARLDEAEGALAKTVLVARQVPERIREGLGEVTALGESLNTTDFASFTESMSAQGKGLGELQRQLSAIAGQLEKMEGRLEGVPATLEKVLQESTSRPSAEKVDEEEVPVVERLDLLFESLESIQDSIDGLLERVATLKPPRKQAAKKTTPPAPEVQEEATPEPESKEEEKRDVHAQVSLPLPVERGSPETGGESPPIDGVRIVVHAMVGISNKLYIRGDEPFLSWDEGIPMDLIGIGEFAWGNLDTKDPVEVSIRFNDEVEANGGTIRLEPGKLVEITPEFPTNLE